MQLHSPHPNFQPGPLAYFRSGMAFPLLLITLPLVLYGQGNFEVHQRGELWETMKDDGTIGAPNPTDPFSNYPSMDWPGGPLELPDKSEQRSYCYGAGMWIGGRHSNGSLFFTENGPFSYLDQGDFISIEKVENFVGSEGYDPTEAEEIITADWVTSENIGVARTSRAWSFPGLNTFIIMEYAISNLNPTAVEDVYVGFPYLIRPSYQDFNVHGGWGDDDSRRDERVVYDSSRALLFAYDDAIETYPVDEGNFWDDYLELRTTGYAGFAVLHADPAADGRAQPSNVLVVDVLNNQRDLSLASNNLDVMYDLLTGADRTSEANLNNKIVPFMLMSCGPYNLSANETIKIVIVEAVNGIPIEDAIVSTVEDVEDAQLNLHWGEDSLKASIDRAIALYNADYALSRVPPPAPAIEVVAVPTTRSITISWDPLEWTWVNPLTGKSDIQYYQVWRSSRAFTGPFPSPIKKIDQGKRTHIKFYFIDRFSDYEKDETGIWVYDDDDISLGEMYFYAVTAVDSAGQESWLTNRNTEGLMVISEPAANSLNLKVFPNPFRVTSGFISSKAANSIVWTHLPATCTIRIYTASGELVRTLEHFNTTASLLPDDPDKDPDTGDEVWDQLTDARLRVAPGIYFWTVESDVGTAQGTLLIIK